MENRRDLQAAEKEYTAEVRSSLAEENSRLFYVGITRSERALMVTGSAIDGTTTKAKVPYAHLEILKATAPDAVVAWWEGEEADVGKLPAEEAMYPAVTIPPGVAEGAELVRATPSDASLDGGIEELWEREVTVLIDEHRRLQSPTLDVEISRELTATDLVNLKNNPEQFARRLRRPVPFKPNTYAKRGTQFHQWLEDRFGASALLDEDQLPGMDEELSEQTFEELRAAFLESRWADRTPNYVEHPFEVVIGGHVIRGRMDAVFHEPDDTWLVVDWKTGQTPRGADMDAAIIQLAVYRIAWASLRGIDPQQVRGAFHYVAHNHTFEPDHLPDADELALLLDGAQGL